MYIVASKYDITSSLKYNYYSRIINIKNNKNN